MDEDINADKLWDSIPKRDPVIVKLTGEEHEHKVFNVASYVVTIENSLSLSDVEEIARVLSDAGFKVIQIESEYKVIEKARSQGYIDGYTGGHIDGYRFGDTRSRQMGE